MVHLEQANSDHVFCLFYIHVVRDRSGQLTIVLHHGKNQHKDQAKCFVVL